jgi:hypothetical protein
MEMRSPGISIIHTKEMIHEIAEKLRGVGAGNLANSGWFASVHQPGRFRINYRFVGDRSRCPALNGALNIAISNCMRYSSLISVIGYWSRVFGHRQYK